jgi:predicted outer membrane protein
MRTTRYVTGTGLVVGALAVTVVALMYPVMSAFNSGVVGSGSNINAQTVATQYGPLTALDRTFVTKVRLAGLWEFPAGQMAEQKGTTAAVKTAGKHLIDGHTDLDAAVRKIAPQLGITLPNEPTPQQQGFLATLSAASGADFDQKFANIVRLAHGQVFSVIAQVRATTQNTMVRQLAEQANSTVLDHMKVLEETGLVDFGQIATNTTASPTNPSAQVAPTPSAGSPTVIVTTSPTFSLPPAASSPESQTK